MDMPINIVPAPLGALVALYMTTTSPSVRESHLVDLTGNEDGDELFYIVRPVVAWGFYRDQDELRLTNHAMVADDTGSLMFAGLKPSHASQELRSFSDLDAEMGYPLDGICTPKEATLRISQITDGYPEIKVCRYSAARFTDELLLILP